MQLNVEVIVLQSNVTCTLIFASCILDLVHEACCCRQRLYLPADLSQGAGLDPEEVFAGRSSKALQTVVEQVATRAQVASTFTNAVLEPLELRLSSVG